MPGRTLASRWSLRTCRILNSLKAGRKVSGSPFRRSTSKTRRGGMQGSLLSHSFMKALRKWRRFLLWELSVLVRVCLQGNVGAERTIRLQASSHETGICESQNAPACQPGGFRTSLNKTVGQQWCRVCLSKLASRNPKRIPWPGSPALRTAFLESLPRQGSDRVQARSHSSFIASGVFPGTPHSRYQGLPVEASVIRFAHPCGAALSGVPSLRSVAARFQRFTSPWVKSRPGGRFSLLNEGSGSTPWSTAAFVQQAELPTNPR